MVSIAWRRSDSWPSESFEPLLELGVLLDRERVRGPQLVVSPAKRCQPSRAGWLAIRCRRRPELEDLIRNPVDGLLLVDRPDGAGGGPRRSKAECSQAERPQATDLDQRLLADQVEGEAALELGDLGRPVPVLGAAQAIARGDGRCVGAREELPIAGLGRPDLGQRRAQGLLPAGGGSHVDGQVVTLHDHRRLACGQLAHLPIGSLDLIAAHRLAGPVAGLGGLRG